MTSEPGPSEPSQTEKDATETRIEAVLAKLRAGTTPRSSGLGHADGDASQSQTVQGHAPDTTTASVPSPYAFPSSLSRLLATYSSQTWFAKPAGLLDPLTCASHGWKNTGIDALECDGCGRKLAVRVSLSDAEMANVESKKGFTVTRGADTAPSEISLEREVQLGMAKRFHVMLSTEHSDNCRFRTGFFTDIDTRFPTVLPSEAGDRFVQRAQDLAKAVPQDKLPSDFVVFGSQVSEKIPNEYLDILKSFQNLPDDTRYLLLSLFGWTPHPTPPPDRHRLSCPFCLRQPGLWLFRTTSGPNIARTFETGPFDLAQEHSVWCPWIDPARGNGTPGWLLTLRTLERAAGASDSATGSPERPKKKYKIGEVGEEGEEVLSLDEATRRIRSFLYV